MTEQPTEVVAVDAGGTQHPRRGRRPGRPVPGLRRRGQRQPDRRRAGGRRDVRGGERVGGLGRRRCRAPDPAGRARDGGCGQYLRHRRDPPPARGRRRRRAAGPRVRPAGDVLLGHPSPDGYAVIAGTGAGAIRVEDGRQVAVADGLGWLLGDEGSGFWIGQRVVRAALADLDGRGPSTALTPLVLGRLGVPAPSDAGDREPILAVVRALYAGPPVRLADFAGLVFEVDRDQTADGILDDAAAALARTLTAVRSADRLGSGGARRRHPGARPSGRRSTRRRVRRGRGPDRDRRRRRRLGPRPPPRRDPRGRGRLRRGDDLTRRRPLSSLCRRPRKDSNLRSRLRRAVLYPLSYGGSGGTTIPAAPAAAETGAASARRPAGSGRRKSVEGAARAPIPLPGDPRAALRPDRRLPGGSLRPGCDHAARRRARDGHGRASAAEGSRRLRHQRRAPAGQAAGQPPREFAGLVAARLAAADGIAGVEVAGPGSSTSASTRPRRARWPTTSSRPAGVRRLRGRARSRRSTSSSSRPTRPARSHLASARWAAVGDALARLLEASRPRRDPRVLLQRRRRPDRPVRRSLLRRGAARADPGGRLPGQYITEIAEQVVAAHPEAPRAARRRGPRGRSGPTASG